MEGVYPERGTDYCILLERYNYDSLGKRRVYSSLVFLHKLLRGGVDCPDLLSQINFSVPRINARQSLTFSCERARTNVMLRSPVNFMCSNYNKICRDCNIFVCNLHTLRAAAETI